jgi:hypothetical protein
MAIEIRAGLRKPYGIFIKEAKDGLKDKGRVELHGLGASITNVVRAAEMLTSQGYADLVSFNTLTFSESHSEGGQRNKPKVVITLTKSATFDKAFEDFEKTKQSRSS